ncbi:MAG: PilZ domain-containing protein [Candidatus Acidiferrales bacterium]
MSGQDRRQRARFDMEIPLSIRTLEIPRTRARTGKTKNISATGLYLASDLPLEVGAPLEISLLMPEQVTGKPACEWCCRGRVVRVQPPDERHENPGAAVEFHYYEVVDRKGARFQN